jgi:hypothetical protein
MKVATLALGAASSAVVVRSDADIDTLDDIMTVNDVAVLVSDDVAATQQMVSIHEALRGAMQIVRESPEIQKWVGGPTDFWVGVQVLGEGKDPTATTAALGTVQLGTAAPPGTVAIVLEGLGGFSVIDRSAFEVCVHALEAVDYNPA